MAWLCWLYVVSFYGLVPLVKANCTPQTGNCCADNNQYANDATVYSTTAINCSFLAGLCCYRQGCLDNGMGNWSTTEGHATVNRQTSTEVNIYSVLESPFVRISTQSCVEFSYARGRPYQLQVSLKLSNSTQPLYVTDSLHAGDQTKTTFRYQIHPMEGKIQFRVIGGGAPPAVPQPKLYYVIITEGNCEENVSPRDPTIFDPPTCEVDILTSPTTEKPAGTHPTSSSTSGTPATNSIGHTLSTASRPHIASSRIVSSAVSSSPSGGELAPSSVPTSLDSSVSSVLDTMTASGMPPEKAPPGDMDSGANVGVIAGASIAAVVVAVVVFVFIYIVFRRKRSSRKPDGDESRILRRSTPTGDTGYVNIVAAGSSTQTTVFTADAKSDDPYELAEDGVPGKTRNSFTDTYNFIPEDHDQPNGTLDGDYSRVDDVHGPAAGSSVKNDAQATQDCKDVYSVVNKPGKKPASPADYSLAKIVDEKPALPNPNDVYSVVNKKGKKPTIAPKPGTSDAEYNTTSHTGRSTTKQGAGDATADTYNRIGAVPSLGPNGQSQESTTDEYNTLDFADARQTASRKEKSGAYDHVSNNPDDSGYSKTRIGERNVVIDSEYHHLQA